MRRTALCAWLAISAVALSCGQDTRDDATDVGSVASPLVRGRRFDVMRDDGRVGGEAGERRGHVVRRPGEALLTGCFRVFEHAARKTVGHIRRTRVAVDKGQRMFDARAETGVA